MRLGALGSSLTNLVIIVVLLVQLVLLRGQHLVLVPLRWLLLDLRALRTLDVCVLYHDLLVLLFDNLLLFGHLALLLR